ncbi:MAG: PQ-loop repeat-containing protein [Bacteroidaceae bacterium]|nr:PQ-loop repeat-containing protein [Bacteroidaceae bacterium]MBP5629980.1 PQ-loop repeat-containing protein [Bacteroidaceae bacterium]
MEQSTIFQICGLVASVCMILGYLPQAIETIRTRKTDGIALPTFLMTGVGSIAFMIQGLLNEPNIIWSLVLTNFVTTICSCIVFGIKIYNYYFKDSRSKQPS